MAAMAFDGKALRAARKAAHQSQEELASSLEVSQALVSAWERGTSQPSEEHVELLTQVLDGFSPPTPFGIWVQKTRALQNMKVKDLADAAGVSVLTIYNVESGRTSNPQGKTREKLERALGHAVPEPTARAIEQKASVDGLGEMHDFDPHNRDDWPADPGIYVFYDVSDRPIYVGQGGNMASRIRDHEQKFWFKRPIVDRGMFIAIQDGALRRQVERILIKFLKSNAVINQRDVDRD